MWPFSKKTEKKIERNRPCYGCEYADCVRWILKGHDGIEYAFCYPCITDALRFVLDMMRNKKITWTT